MNTRVSRSDGRRRGYSRPDANAPHPYIKNEGNLFHIELERSRIRPMSSRGLRACLYTPSVGAMALTPKKYTPVIFSAALGRYRYGMVQVAYQLSLILVFATFPCVGGGFD
ncbi:hypothetical protein BDW69DRAFT_91335 [Aspergillus filifer]